MSGKEFDLFLAMMLALLKDGKVDEVINLIEEARAKSDSK